MRWERRRSSGVYGYSDDYYNDNGYYKHDDGTGDQCKGVGNAWVTITVLHHTPQDVPGVPHPKAKLDMWWDKIDDSFLPLNPEFGLEYFENIHPDAATLCDRFPNGGDHTTFGDPPCTTQRPTVDEPSGFASAICQMDFEDGHFPGTVHGHVNWFNVSYSGKVAFQDWQSHFWEDDDIDMLALTSNYNGVLTTNDVNDGTLTTINGTPISGTRLLGMEFKYGETLEYFNTPTWNYIKANLEDKSNGWPRIQGLINNKPAYFSGLFGIDNQHHVRTEMHPVHFLAIKVSETTVTEKWIFFARNWGNEGMCSQDYHGFAGESFNFFIPDAIDLNVGQSVINCSSLSLNYKYNIVSDGLLMSFPMSPSKLPTLWHGEISITKRPSLNNPSNGKDSSILTSSTNNNKEEEGYDKIAKDLTHKEIKRWQKNYRKQLLNTENQGLELIDKGAYVNYDKKPLFDTSLHHNQIQLAITDERTLNNNMIQMKKPDQIDAIKKEALYIALTKAIKKKSRREAIITQSLNSMRHDQRQ